MTDQLAPVRKCGRCRCLRSDFTKSERLCDRCTDPETRRAQWAATKTDPERHARHLESKRKARVKQAAKLAELQRVRAARWRVVNGGDDEGDDVDPIAYRQRMVVAPLMARYAAGESTTEIAAAVGRSPGHVYRLLQAAGVKFRTRGEATSIAIIKWGKLRAATVDAAAPSELYAEYAGGSSLAALAKKFGYTIIVVKRILTGANIRIRSSEEQWKIQFGANKWGASK